MKKSVVVLFALVGVFVAVGCSNKEKADVKDLEGKFYTLYEDPDQEVQRSYLTFSKDGNSLDEVIIYNEENPNSEQTKSAKENIDQTYADIKITTDKDQYKIVAGDKEMIYKKIGEYIIEDQEGRSYSRNVE